MLPDPPSRANLATTQHWPRQTLDATQPAIALLHDQRRSRATIRLVVLASKSEGPCRSALAYKTSVGDSLYRLLGGAADLVESAAQTFRREILCGA